MTVYICSNHNNICQQFNDWTENNNLDLWKGTFDKSYQITYWRQRRKRFLRGYYANVTCYNPSSGNGWCGTCYDYGRDSVSFTETGFCPTGDQYQTILSAAFEKHNGKEKTYL